MTLRRIGGGFTILAALRSWTRPRTVSTVSRRRLCSPMRPSAVVLIGLLAGVLVGCGRGQTSIPTDAPELHIVVTASEVRLDPATVRAGDLYVVLDTPGSSVGFVQRQRSAAETPGPLSDEDLARLADGDLEGTAIGGFSDAGCSAQQRAEDRGRIGPCGNVVKVVLTAGKDAFFNGPLANAKARADLGWVPV